MKTLSVTVSRCLSSIFLVISCQYLPACRYTPLLLCVVALPPDAPLTSCGHRRRSLGTASVRITPLCERGSVRQLGTEADLAKLPHGRREQRIQRKQKNRLPLRRSSCSGRVLCNRHTPSSAEPIQFSLPAHFVGIRHLPRPRKVTRRTPSLNLPPCRTSPIARGREDLERA